MEKKVTLISIGEIVRNENQPRKHFNEQSIKELSESIKKDGLMQPITVRPLDGKYEIVQGERRYRACKLAGLTEMPAFVQELSDEDTFHLAVIENIQREQLTPIEEAEAFQKYVEMGYKHNEIAEKINKKRSFVTSRLRLLKLMPDIQDWIAEGKISEGHAIQILAANNEICRIMEVSQGVHGTEDPFIYFQRLFMSAFKDSDKISVKDVKQFKDRFKYLLVSSELTWLTFQALPSYIKENEKIRLFALRRVTLALELGSNLQEFKNEDIEDMFEYAIKHKDEDIKLWEIYKAMEEWQEFITENDFSVVVEDELIEKLKRRDLVSELNIY